MMMFRFLTGFGTATGPWSTLSVLLRFASASGDRLLAGSAATGSCNPLALTDDRADLLVSHECAGSYSLTLLSDAALISLGVMFVTDHLLDDRSTSFDKSSRIETVSH